jgi:hypothetical protein
MWWSTAWAWNGSGIDWSWQDAPVDEPFVLNTDSFAPVGPADEVEAVFERALRTWSVEGEADLFLEYGGRTDETRQGSGDDGVNVAVFGSRDFFAGLAVATTWQDGRRLVDCDLTVHRRNGYGDLEWHLGEGDAPRNAFDLTNTLTHELGHCLGLAHSQRSTAMMSPYSTPGTGEAARHLTEDDREGLQALYGRVAPDLVLEDAAADDVVDGATTLTFTVRNLGDGSAFDVVLASDLGELVVGDVGAPTLVGARVGPDGVSAFLPVEVDCSETTLPVEATLADARGRTWDVAAEVPLVCPAADAGNGPAGCGCASGPRAPGAAILLLGLALRSRRQAR